MYSVKQQHCVGQQSPLACKQDAVSDISGSCN